MFTCSPACSTRCYGYWCCQLAPLTSAVTSLNACVEQHVFAAPLAKTGKIEKKTQHLHGKTAQMERQQMRLTHKVTREHQLVIENETLW